jgi:hypothetical protein
MTIESNPLPVESIIAACNICLLASCMKNCQSCPLNPGSLLLDDDQRAKVDRKELLKPSLKPV